MNIPKAIEELQYLRKGASDRLTPGEKQAIKLGIEALERFRDYHEDDELLPSETP